MRTSVAVPLAAVSLWIAGTAAPVRAGTVGNLQNIANASDPDHENLPSSSVNHSFDSQTWVFQISDVALVVGGNLSCSQDPDTTRGGGGSGSKRRHAAPTDSKSCTHVADSGTGVTLTLNPWVDQSSCGSGTDPDTKPVGGGGSKRRHQTPMGEAPCKPGQPSPFPSRPGLLSMSWGSGGTQTSGGLPPDLSEPGGGATGKRRHSSPTTSLPGHGQPPSVPEPSALFLLGSGLVGIAVAGRIRRRGRATGARH
jgi:hypothetical protein